MKLTRVALVAGWLLMGGGLSYAVAADCGPPSQAEIAAEQATLLTEADADGDGALSRDEFTTFDSLFQEVRANHHFNCLDSNGDGLVSSDELSAWRPGGPGHGGPF
jgi:hypothetical protein